MQSRWNSFQAKQAVTMMIFHMEHLRFRRFSIIYSEADSRAIMQRAMHRHQRKMLRKRKRESTLHSTVRILPKRQETAELTEALVRQTNVEEELGDTLFMTAKIAQMSGIDPEEALHCACDKFDARFREVEESAGKPLAEYSEEELLALAVRSGL